MNNINDLTEEEKYSILKINSLLGEIIKYSNNIGGLYAYILSGDNAYKMTIVDFINSCVCEDEEDSILFNNLLKELEIKEGYFQNICFNH